jgi:hypothetical protein
MNTASAMRPDDELLDDFALAAMDFENVDGGPAAKSLRKAFNAMREAVEMARQEEQAAAWWTKRIADWAEWSRMSDGRTKERAAALLVGDFDDIKTAIDFLTCPPLDSLSLLSLSDGGRIPTNAYEAFAASLRGGRAGEMEIAESSGPVERYTYRLRMLRNEGESRSAVYRWRRLGQRCGFRLLKKHQSVEMAPSRLPIIPAARRNAATMSGVNHDAMARHSMVRRRDGPRALAGYTEVRPTKDDGGNSRATA